MYWLVIFGKNLFISKRFNSREMALKIFKETKGANEARLYNEKNGEVENLIVKGYFLEIIYTNGRRFKTGFWTEEEMYNYLDEEKFISNATYIHKGVRYHIPDIHLMSKKQTQMYKPNTNV